MNMEWQGGPGVYRLVDNDATYRNRAIVADKLDGSFSIQFWNDQRLDWTDDGTAFDSAEDAMAAALLVVRMGATWHTD